MHHRTAALAAILIITVSVCCYGRLHEIESISSKTYSTRHGLPSNSISDIIQDERGFIWACTQQGVVRYDGQEFIVYSDYPDQLSLNTASCQFDLDGKLWIATTRGLISMKDGHYLKYDLGTPDTRNDITTLMRDSKGCIWGINNHSLLFSINDGQIRLHHIPEYLSGVRLYQLDRHYNNGIWVLTSKGLFQYADSKWSSLELPDSIRTTITQFFPESRDSMWVTGSNGDLYNIVSGNVSTYQLVPRDQSLNVYDIVRDQHGGIWIATSKGIFFIRKGQIDQFDVTDQISSNMIYCLCIDREGLLWYGSDNGMGRIFGLQFRQIRPTDELPLASVMDMTLDKNGAIWCATSGGVICLEAKSTRTWTASDGLQDDYCLSLLERDDEIYVSNSIGIFGISENKARRIAKIDNLVVLDMIASPDERILCATDQGVYELKDGKLISINSFLRLDGIPEVNTVRFDHLMNLWILTEESGVHVYRYPSFQEVQIGGTNVRHAYCFYQAQDQIIWIGTNTGVFQYDGSNLKMLFDASNGLISNSIWSIEQDSEQNMWFATSKGLSCLNQGRFINYDVEDGISGDDFIANCVIKDREQRLWFGGSGITLVDSEYIQPLIDPTIELKSSVSDGKPVLEGGKLPNDMKYIEFRFACLSFANETRNKYRFQLIGFDPFKSPMQLEPFVRYTSLPTGSYTIVAEAANRDGTLTRYPARFSFEVLPAWWELIHIRTGLLTLAIMLIVGIMRIRNSRIRHRAEVLQAEVDQQTDVIKKQMVKLEEQRDRLEKLSITDDMTKIYNRRFFFRQLISEWQRHTRYRRPISVILFDIDHFKGFNDTYGHAIGDEVLVSVARMIGQQVRRTDTLARYGGEEFAVLLPETDRATAIEVAERIRISIESMKVFSESSGNLQVSISGGIATRDLESGPLNPDALMQEADLALYRAKNAGRNRTIHFQDTEKKSDTEHEVSNE